jgi:hypothetical protein
MIKLDTTSVQETGRCSVLDRAQAGLVGCVDAARKKFLYHFKVGLRAAGGRLRPGGHTTRTGAAGPTLRAGYKSRCGD